MNEGYGKLRQGRYALEWTLVTLACVAALELLPDDLLAGGAWWYARMGMLLAAAANLAVFFVVGRTAVAEPGRVIHRWLLATIGKLVVFALAGGIVAIRAQEALRPFLLSLGAAFLPYSLHLVTRLVQAMDRCEAARKESSEMSRGRATEAVE